MNNLVLKYCDNELIFINRDKDYYSNLSSLELAIENAANGQNHNQVMDRHQCHIGYQITKQAELLLIKNLRKIKNSTNFEEIFEITEKVKTKIHMTGDLWSYDTALRLGFYKGIYPGEVYLQSGAKDGARKLLNLKRVNKRALDKKLFVQRINELEKLQCYEIENFLCINKAKFE